MMGQMYGMYAHLGNTFLIFLLAIKFMASILSTIWLLRGFMLSISL